MLLSWILYKRILHQPDLPEHWDHILSGWHQPALWVAFFLMFINWGLESRKWQLLLSHLEDISFLKAFKSVLAGTSISMLTPNRMGEYAGRIMFVSEGHRLTAISLTLLGSISQLLITLVMGLIGLLVFRNTQHLPSDYLNIWVWVLGNIVFFVSLFFVVMLALIFLRIGRVVKFLSGFGVFKRFVNHISVLDTFSRKQLLRILFLSLIRYLVFILQYLLLLQVFGVAISWHLCFWLLTIFYLLMAVVPSIGISELPMRASVSVELLALFSSNVIGIQAAAFGIWVINLAIPALLGSLFMLGHKIFNER